MKLPIGYRSRLKDINANSLKLNNKQISDQSGISRPTIIKWMRDDIVMAKPDWSVMLALSNFFGLNDPNQLLEPVFEEGKESPELVALPNPA